MNHWLKWSIGAGLVALVVVSIASQFIFVSRPTYENSSYTTNAGELVRDTLVGQTFVAAKDNLSGVSVMFATYSGRENDVSVKFYLRSGIDSTENIRVAEVSALELKDNRLHKFEFEPIPDSAGKTYFFFVVSPAGEPGNAITVDLDTRDPYHQGTAFLVRGKGEAVTNPEILARSGKPTVDVVFGIFAEVPLREAIITEVRDAIRTFIVTWESNRGRYLVWAIAAISAVTLVGLAIGLWLWGEVTSKQAWIILSLLFILGLVLRLWYADSLPITNDEGNYLYDAVSLRRGILAGGDGYVKTPLTIVWLSIWQMILGNTLIAGRMASIVAGGLTMMPVYALGSLSFSRRAGLLGAAGWALLGAPVAFNVYVHTQPVAMLFTASGVALLWWSLKNQKKASWLLGAGMLLGLGAASRKSSLAVGLVPVMLLIIESRSWTKLISRTLMTAVGFGLIITAFLGSAYGLYGTEGVLEALGVNSAEDGVNAVDPAEAEQVLAYSLRGMTPFFRESLPFILLAVVGWGVVLEKLVRLKFNWWLAKIVWLLPVWALFWAFSFFWEYEGGIFVKIGGMEWLWWAIWIVFGLVAIYPRIKVNEKVVSEQKQAPGLVIPKSSQPRNTMLRDRGAVTELQENSREEMPRHSLAASLLAPLWIFGLVVFYISWIKFHANYIVEFLLPLCVLLGVGLLAIWENYGPKWVRVGLASFSLLIVLWAAWLSNVITYTYEHTGTFDQGSLKEAAVWAQENIPLETPIFTGAAAVPYLSGHRVALDIAHPRWYAYQFTREDTVRLNTFLPPAEEMVQAFRAAEWVLLEKQTGFSFLMEYSEIERGIEKDFELVHEIENGSNTLRFYRRKV